MSTFFKQNYRKYWFSVVFNAVLLIFYLLFFNCCYETNDDFAMKLLASGAYGHPEFHLDFINVIYGYVLVLLYTIVPRISWYDIFQLLILMFSFVNITYILVNKKGGKESIIIFLLIAILAYSFYVWFQFTKSASIATCAGYLCITYYLDTKDRKVQILGIVMITLGIWLRVNQFLSCSLLCISLFIPYLMNKNGFANTIKKLVVTGSVCAIILIFSIVINNIEYSSNEWNTYRVYQTKTAQLTDFGWPEYDTNINVYEKIDLDRNAYELYSSWNYNDINKLDIKEVDTLVNESNKKTINLSYIITFFYRACNYFLNYKSISYISVLVISIVLMYIFVSTKTTKINIAIIYLLICMLLLTAYCYYIRLDGFYNRIELSYLFVVLICILYFVDIIKIDIKAKQICILCVVCFIISCLFRLDSVNVSFLGINNSVDENKKAIYTEITKDKNHLYIMKVNERVDDYNFKLLNSSNDNKFINIAYFGGWTANNPLLLNCMSNFDVINPYIDVIDNDKAYICTKDINQIIKYLQKYYGSSIKATKVKNIEDYIVYKIENKK